VDSARWKEALCAIQSVGELKNVATAGGWWSDSGLLLGRWSQAKGFHQSSCCLGGLIHDRVFRHAPHFLNTDPTKRLRPRQKLAFRHQSAPLVSQVRLMPARPPISTNRHRPGENGRPAQEKLAICESVCSFFIPGAAYGYTVPPISTNAHQVGKSLRLAQKNSSPNLAPTPSGGRSQPSNILVHIKSAKTIALEQRNFALEKFTYQNSQLCP